MTEKSKQLENIMKAENQGKDVIYLYKQFFKYIYNTR